MLVRLLSQAELIWPASFLLSMDNSFSKRYEWVMFFLLSTVQLYENMWCKKKILTDNFFSYFYLPQGFSFLFRIICAIHLPAGSATCCFMMEKNVQVQHERLHSHWHFPLLLSLLRMHLKGMSLSLSLLAANKYLSKFILLLKYFTSQNPELYNKQWVPKWFKTIRAFHSMCNCK